MKLASDPRALTDTLFQAKFDEASRYGPGEEGGDEKRGDRGCRHDEKDPALHVSHVRDGLCQFSAGLLVDALDQTRSQSLRRFQFVVHPKANSLPVARCSQSVDGLEL